MSKQSRMKKRMIFEGVVAAGVIAALVGGMIGTGAWFSSTDTKRNNLRSEVSSIDSKLNEITGQIDESTDSQAIYDEIVKQKSNLDFIVVREDGLTRIGALREKYRLSSLNLSMAPEVKLELPKLQNLNAQVTQIDVELKFGAMSDVHVFSFIDDIRRSLPGFVRIERLEIEREKAMDVSIYQQMSKGALPQMVSGVVNFKWIGLVAPTVDPNAVDPANPVGADAPMAAPIDGGIMPPDPAAP